MCVEKFWCDGKVGSLKKNFGSKLGLILFSLCVQTTWSCTVSTRNQPRVYFRSNGSWSTQHTDPTAEESFLASEKLDNVPLPKEGFARMPLRELDLLKNHPQPMPNRCFAIFAISQEFHHFSHLAWPKYPSGCGLMSVTHIWTSYVVLLPLF